MKNENNKEKDMKILLTITTTPGSDWRKKIKEINALKINEIALFPTAIDKKDRLELYKLLKMSTVKKIPFVHLRSDMDIFELDYFIENYGTKVFNTHTAAEFSVNSDWQKYRKIIFIENVFYPFNREEINKFAGVCVDFAHLETDRLSYRSIFDSNIKIMDEFRVGCNHISAIKKETWTDNSNKNYPNKIRHDFHRLGNLSEFDYLKNYPRKYFASYIAIELENSIKEQMEARNYIENIIKTLQ